MAIPNDRTFTLNDVCVETQSWSLPTAFQYSTDSYFDPRYKGSKDRLSNFRNYGWNGDIGNEIDSLITFKNFDEAPLLIDQVPGQPQFIMAKRNPIPYIYDVGGAFCNPYYKGAATYLNLMAVADNGTIVDYETELNFIRQYPTDLLIIDNEHCILTTQAYSVEGDFEGYGIHLIKFSTSDPLTILDTQAYAASHTNYPNRIRVAYRNGYLYVINRQDISSQNYIYRYNVSVDISVFPFERSLRDPVQVVSFGNSGGDIYIQGDKLFLSHYISTTNYISVYQINANGSLTYLTRTTTSGLLVDIDGNKDDMIFSVSQRNIYAHSWNGSSIAFEDFKVMSTADKIFPSISYSELTNTIVVSNEDVARSYRIDGSLNLVQEDTLFVTTNEDGDLFGRPYCVRNNFYKAHSLFGMWDTKGALNGFDPILDIGAYLKTFAMT